MSPVESDVLIIGCGIAGASAALRLSEDRQRQITIVTRAADPEESNSKYAQGGIVTLGKEDSVDLIVRDILEAGAGLSLPSAARILAEEGPGSGARGVNRPGRCAVRPDARRRIGLRGGRRPFLPENPARRGYDRPGHHPRRCSG